MLVLCVGRIACYTESSRIANAKRDSTCVGTRHWSQAYPRNIWIKNGRAEKRTKVDTKRARALLGLHDLSYYDDLVVGSSFQALHVSMRRDGGIDARVKI